MGHIFFSSPQILDSKSFLHTVTGIQRKKTHNQTFTLSEHNVFLVTIDFYFLDHLLLLHLKYGYPCASTVGLKNVITHLKIKESRHKTRGIVSNFTIDLMKVVGQLSSYFYSAFHELQDYCAAVLIGNSYIEHYCCLFS